VWGDPFVQTRHVPEAPELGLLAGAVPPVGTGLEPAFARPGSPSGVGGGRLQGWISKPGGCRSGSPTARSSWPGLKLPLQGFSWKLWQEQLGKLAAAIPGVTSALGCSEVG